MEGSLETKPVLNQAIGTFWDQKRGLLISLDLRTAIFPNPPLHPHCPKLDGIGILIVP